MKSLSFIFIRLTFYLVFGILFYFYFLPAPMLIAILASIGITLFFISFFRSRKLLFDDILFGISTFLLVGVIGITSAFLSVPENNELHYSNLPIEEYSIAKAEILEQLKPTKSQERYLAKINSLQNDKSVHKTNGKILINIPKKDDLIFEPGVQMLIPADFQSFNRPKNPYDFDYANYMRNQKVSGQIFLTKTKIIRIDKRSFSLKRIRANIILKLDRSGMEQKELSILKALILGERSEISTDLYKSYAAAGAVHILAISGLHIGVLLLFLNFLFKPIERIRKGRLIKLLLILIILWVFAVLTGLSPSVVRAVTMFSFIAVGLQIRKKSSVINSVFLSLFFLLLINPYFLFQVGFQMSYLAVIGIIVLPPKLKNLFHINFKIGRYFWELITVSVAAQIAVLPLSLYYFHQFPGLFLLTNILVLPLLSIVLIYGFTVIILASIGFLPAFISKGLGLLLSFMNTIVLKISSFSELVIENINFSLLQLLSCYLILCLVTLLLYQRKSNLIFAILISVLLFQFATLEKHLSKPKYELVIFQQIKGISIVLRKNAELHYFGKDTAATSFQNYKANNFIRKQHLNNSISAFNICDQKFIIIDSSGRYVPFEMAFQHVILENSPKINLQRLIDELHPKSLIVTNNNYPSLQKLWKQTALKEKIPFHSINEKGAYILNCD